MRNRSLNTWRDRFEMATPVLVLNPNTKRESGKRAQIGNIETAKTIAEVIRTCLGPRAMLKMLMDPMGGIVMTNDGNAILREIQVQHPAAKTMIEISRTQDEEVGDGTTSVIILAGEMLSAAEPFLGQQMHPTTIIAAYRQALDDILTITKEKISVAVDVTKREEMMKIVRSSISTKFIKKWADLACGMALDAVQMVAEETGERKEIDIKRYAKTEKIPGGSIEESEVLRGVMLNKDVTHSRMRRRIENPKILLLDCPLEYKKGESQTNVEVSGEEDFAKLLQLEEDYVHKICNDIISLNPDLVITEKGVSDLAQHFLVKHNITAIRRVKKTDNNRIAKACGATICNRTDEVKESDIGTKCGLFEVRKIGDEYFTYLVECQDPKACTIVLRGASKDILNEVDRNLQDAMQVARNIVADPYLVPGGGATEMALAQALNERAKSVAGVQQWPYRAVSKALEVIPRTLLQNCGANTIRVLTTLRAKHAAEGNTTWGVDGDRGVIADMRELEVWEPLSVKVQTFKTAIETAILLLRIDDIVSGSKKSKEESGGTEPAE